MSLVSYTLIILINETSSLTHILISSLKLGSINMVARDVRGLLQPDKIAFSSGGQGNTPFLVTADEGKPTAIPGTTFQDYQMAMNICKLLVKVVAEQKVALASLITTL